MDIDSSMQDWLDAFKVKQSADRERENSWDNSKDTLITASNGTFKTRMSVTKSTALTGKLAQLFGDTYESDTLKYTYLLKPLMDWYQSWMMTAGMSEIFDLMGDGPCSASWALTHLVGADVPRVVINAHVDRCQNRSSNDEDARKLKECEEEVTKLSEKKQLENVAKVDDVLSEENRTFFRDFDWASMDFNNK